MNHAMSFQERLLYQRNSFTVWTQDSLVYDHDHEKDLVYDHDHDHKKEVENDDDDHDEEA